MTKTGRVENPGPRVGHRAHTHTQSEGGRGVNPLPDTTGNYAKCGLCNFK